MKLKTLWLSFSSEDRRLLVEALDTILSGTRYTDERKNRDTRQRVVDLRDILAGKKNG